MQDMHITVNKKPGQTVTIELLLVQCIFSKSIQDMHMTVNKKPGQTVTIESFSQYYMSFTMQGRFDIEMYRKPLQVLTE